MRLSRKYLVLAFIAGFTGALLFAPRFRGGVRGFLYRISGRRPDPSASGNVLADRIRSTLGPLEARLDLPHIHVMVQDHVALLHGDVATAEDAEELEQAVACIYGVEGVESYLHVGLLPSDTRPSQGAHVHAPSDALRRLLGAVLDAGVGPQHAPRVVRAILGAFLQRLPEGERQQFAAHLPSDVRRLASAPRFLGRIRKEPSNLTELTSQIVARDAGVAEDQSPEVVAAVLRTLRELVPEETADVASVLPGKLRELWLTAS